MVADARIRLVLGGWDCRGNEKKICWPVSKDLVAPADHPKVQASLGS